MFWFLLGSRFGRRPNPTPDSKPNPNPNPDSKPQPKRAKTRHKHGYADFASNQEISQIDADDDSEVQTTLHIFQVKNIPKDPFFQTAKPTCTLWLWSLFPAVGF